MKQQLNELRRLLRHTRYESPEDPGCCLHMMPDDLLDHKPGDSMTFWGLSTCLMTPRVLTEAIKIDPELKVLWEHGADTRTVLVVIKCTATDFTPRRRAS